MAGSRAYVPVDVAIVVTLISQLDYDELCNRAVAVCIVRCKTASDDQPSAVIPAVLTVVPGIAAVPVPIAMGVGRRLKASVTVGPVVLVPMPVRIAAIGVAPVRIVSL